MFMARYILKFEVMGYLLASGVLDHWEERAMRPVYFKHQNLCHYDELMTVLFLMQ
jgi:hypothetical protein